MEKAAKSHRDAAKKKKQEITEAVRNEKPDIRIEAGEYLSGFYTGDRLLPVVTLVILFTPELWDAPMSIYEMFSVKDPRILSFVPDYRINLIVPAQIKEDDMGKFRSSLREVLLYIKYSKDREQLNRLLENNLRFRNLDTEAAIVIDTITNSELEFDRKGIRVDMCQAVADMRKKERQEGRQEADRRTARNMLKIGNSLEEIAEILELPMETIKAWEQEGDM